MKQISILIFLLSNIAFSMAAKQSETKHRFDKIIIKKYDSKGNCIYKEKIKGSRSFESVDSENSKEQKWLYQGREVKFVAGEYYYPNGRKVKIHYKRKVKYYC